MRTRFFIIYPFSNCENYKLKRAENRKIKRQKREAGTTQAVESHRWPVKQPITSSHHDLVSVELRGMSKPSPCAVNCGRWYHSQICNKRHTSSAPCYASVIWLAIWALLSHHMETYVQGLTTIIAQDPNLQSALHVSKIQTGDLIRTCITCSKEKPFCLGMVQAPV